MKKIIFSFLLMVAFSGIGLSQTSQKIESDEKTSSINPESTTVDTVLNKKMVVTVYEFWRLSLAGDKKKIKDVIRHAPESFWNDCPQKEKLKIESNSDTSFWDGKSRRAEVIGISNSEKNNTYWMLEYFSEQIQNGKPELLQAKIIKATENEAVVKIDWKRVSTSLGRLSQELLLYKDDKGWKVFMITNSLERAKYNKIFATKDKCS